MQIAFNGQHYCEFRHRTPKERITYLVASGDIQVQNITFFGPGLSVRGPMSFLGMRVAGKSCKVVLLDLYAITRISF